ncbi:MAG: bifunctional serine/threonine-protein kinase/formylglycine-generating enzyme family protein [Muribaculaceae bacterium]|nr:bifunctional serine/threonine-protein kinase/formylglycine-generating enzyme family protein [Muribaculaceae bacterium]
MGQTLNNGSLLQGGRYKILSVLGQGGFGITYLAMQSGLMRKVAVKEFFMKEMCSREESSSHVTLGTEGARETVERYREKFLKEARNIARFNHPNIVRTIDVFEENGTAYYVMEYAPCGSLSDKVKKEGYLSEPVATRYIKQIASALDYIHRHKMTHLDVKPSNIMLNEKGETVLIDFGLAKQYDSKSGGQTSSTPVGISEGYAPTEQYMLGGVGTFSPETDVYALGATFFKLLTGNTPPNASFIDNNGIPVDQLVARGVSQQAIAAICQAMKSRKRDRLKTAWAFIAALSRDTTVSNVKDDTLVEATVVEVDKPIEKMWVNRQEREKVRKTTQPVKKENNAWLWALMGVVCVALAVILVYAREGDTRSLAEDEGEVVENVIENVEENTSQEEPEPIKKYNVNGVSFDMVLVKGGTFEMGATPEQDKPDEREIPAHEVTLTNDYYIGKTEVTQNLWQAVMGSNPSHFRGGALPVECVSWNDCQEFIMKLNELTGEQFRLPSEAEWEFAARGGNKSNHYQYSGSNNIDDVAWYDGNSGGMTQPVAQMSSNELGIYDMSGNVAEWCQDREGLYSSTSQVNPTGPNSGSRRIDRGGCWYTGKWSSRLTNRYWRSSDFNRNYLGLRLGLSK